MLAGKGLTTLFFNIKVFLKVHTIDVLFWICLVLIFAVEYPSKYKPYNHKPEQQKFGILVLADYTLVIGDSRAIYFISIERMAIKLSIEITNVIIR